VTIRVDGLRRHVDQPGARLPQQEQEEEIPLLERLLPHALRSRVDAERRDDDNRLWILVEGLQRTPERAKLALQRFEPARDLIGRQSQGLRSKRVCHGPAIVNDRRSQPVVRSRYTRHGSDDG
jgi:hypothetical protein